MRLDKYTIEILKVIKGDVEFLNINLGLDDNKYYYDLIIGNLNDLIEGIK